MLTEYGRLYNVAGVHEPELDQRNSAAGRAVQFAGGMPGILRTTTAVRRGRLQPDRAIVLGPR